MECRKPEGSGEKDTERVELVLKKSVKIIQTAEKNRKGEKGNGKCEKGIATGKRK